MCSRDSATEANSANNEPASPQRSALRTRLLIGTPLLAAVVGLLATDYALERAAADEWGVAMPFLWGFAALILVVVIGAAWELARLLRRIGWHPDGRLAAGLSVLLCVAALFVGLRIAHGQVERTRNTLHAATADAAALADTDSDAARFVATFEPAHVANWTLQRQAAVAPRLLFVAWFACMVVAWVLALWSGPPGEAGHGQRVSRAIGTCFVVTAVGGAFGLALLLRATPQAGLGLVLLALFASRLGDAGAYFAGRLLGCHKLIPNVSPKKTIEGAVGGLAASALLAWLVGLAFPAVLVLLPLPWLLAAGVLLGFAAQAADLMASALKRAAGVKDSSALLPEFGGVIDLVDGFLFSIPMLAAILLVKPYVEALL